MHPNALREHLETLHDELAAASEVDPRSKQLLGEIMQDIRRLMERSAAAASPTTGAGAQDIAGGPDARPLTDPSLTADETSLPDRLEQIAVQFEVDHPTLAASSRRLVDLLGKVGL
jgi:hypothetical protein